MSEEKPVSGTGAILVGAVVALAGVVLVGAAAFASAEKFEAPRWVVASVGGAFLIFGGWTAVIYSLGYDPKQPQDTLPSPLVQLLVLVPGMILFAAPFHWIAFGPGPRQFAASFSIPFLSVRRGGSELPGRIAFGIGALLVDAILVAAVVRLLRPKQPRG